MSVNGDRATDRHGLISIEGDPDAGPPGPNYVFRRIGCLNVFYPNTTPVDAANEDGALAETQPPPLGLQQPPEETPISSDSPEFLRLVENLNGGPQKRQIYGRIAPLYWGRCAVGVGIVWKWSFLRNATFLMYLSFMLNTMTMIETFDKHFGGLAPYLIDACLGQFTFWTFWILAYTDPGVVPKNYSLRDLLAETEEYRARHPDQRYYSYCSECRTCRPPRTFHCPTCDICIRGHEGHLRAAGTCVGERNRRVYFLHVIVQTLWGTFLLVTSLIISINIIKVSSTDTREVIHMVVSGVGGIVLLFILDHGTIFKLIFKMYLICVGRTATEEYRRRHDLDTNDCFVERLSVGGNIRNFFCQKSMPKAFRKIRRDFRGRELEPEFDAWILEQWPRDDQGIAQMREAIDFIQIQMGDIESNIANA